MGLGSRLEQEREPKRRNALSVSALIGRTPDPMLPNHALAPSSPRSSTRTMWMLCSVEWFSCAAWRKSRSAFRLVSGP